MVAVSLLIRSLELTSATSETSPPTVTDHVITYSYCDVLSGKAVVGGGKDGSSDGGDGGATVSFEATTIITAKTLKIVSNDATATATRLFRVRL